VRLHRFRGSDGRIVWRRYGAAARCHRPPCGHSDAGSGARRDDLHGQYDLTYNIFSAAARLGIKRIAWGSSETILGLPFRIPPDFAPLDETHPDRPEWSYALSKKLGEEMADQFARWHADLTILSLRFSNVFDGADYEMRATIDARPASRKVNLWGYVDARDAGEACRLAIEAKVSGHERMIIAAADTVVSVPSAELMATHYPGVPLRHPLDGHVSLLSSARAEALIGYRPRFSWRER
jgi:nucleoside-diphosphate-sugar epimerase